MQLRPECASPSSAVGLVTRGTVRSHVCVVLLLTFAALTADYLFAPSLYNGSTLWSVGVLFVLIVRGKEDTGLRGAIDVLRLERTRLAFFVLLHLVFVVVGRALGSLLHTASLTYTISADATALTKWLVLTPTLVLLPLSSWRQLARSFPSELAASGIVFFTFFPHRLMETLWPWYSQLLGRIACVVAGAFVPNLVCHTGSIPTLAGPKLHVSIILACSGIDSIRLFQLLFAVIVVLDWQRLNRCRVLIAYLLGIATTVMANVLRISLLVILGNRGFEEWIMRQHVNAGWAVFSVAFLAFLSLTYNWMLQLKQTLAF